MTLADPSTVDPIVAGIRRQARLDRAIACVGLTGEDYTNFICVEGDDRVGMTKASGCGLVERELLREDGFPLDEYPELGVYVRGMAIANVLAVLERCGALVPVTTPLEVADVVHLGGPDHILTVSDVNGDLVSTIQGGERDPARNEIIQTIVRRYSVVAGVPHLDARPILHLGSGALIVPA